MRFTLKNQAGSSRLEAHELSICATPSAKVSLGSGAASISLCAWRSAGAWSHLKPARMRVTSLGVGIERRGPPRPSR